MNRADVHCATDPELASVLRRALIYGLARMHTNTPVPTWGVNVVARAASERKRLGDSIDLLIAEKAECKSLRTAPETQKRRRGNRDGVFELIEEGISMQHHAFADLATTYSPAS